MSNKGYKSFASHYILLPDGRIEKWPIVTVDGSGVILQLEWHDNFKERPNLEMHPGILLPGFVDLCETNFGNEEVAPNFNRHFAHGTILLGSSYSHQNKPLPRLVPPNIIDEDCPNFLLRDGEMDISLFQRMKAYHQNSSEHKLPEILFWATQWGASRTEFGNQLGQLKEGFKPGVMVLQKVDLNAMRLVHEAQVKWLSAPIFD